MLTATEICQLRKRSPAQLDDMIKKLGIAPPQWKDDNECTLAARLDDAVTEELSKLLKSESVISGYINLLTIGKIPFRFNETDNELLSKIVHSKEKITEEIRRRANKGKYDIQTKHVAAPRPDFSHVSCNLWRKESDGRGLKLIRKILKSFVAPSVDIAMLGPHIFADQELIGRIRDMICEYCREHRVTDIDSIDIIIKSCPRPLLPKQEIPIAANTAETAPVFDEEEINHVLNTLETVNNVIEKIKG